MFYMVLVMDKETWVRWINDYCCIYDDDEVVDDKDDVVDEKSDDASVVDDDSDEISLVDEDNVDNVDDEERYDAEVDDEERYDAGVDDAKKHVCWQTLKTRPLFASFFPDSITIVKTLKAKLLRATTMATLLKRNRKYQSK